MENLKVTIVIPCLNEAETIQRAIAQALEGIRLTGVSGEVLVADNGSMDGSQSLSEHAGARVVSVPEKGYGAALHGGILAARGEIVVMGDADLSYPFLETTNLVTPILERRADFVLGNRLNSKMQPNAMPTLNRTVGTPVLSFLLRRLCGSQVSDCNSGMRAFKKSDYVQWNMQCPGMEYASEMLVAITRFPNLRYLEVDIGFKKDQRSRPPHLKRWRDGWRHLRFILGSSSSWVLVNVPLLIGTLCYLSALGLSFGEVYGDGKIRYHSAFALLSLGMMLFTFSMSQIYVRALRVEAGVLVSRGVDLLNRFCMNGAPFYWSLVLFLIAGFQGLSIFWQWRAVSYGELEAIGGILRLVMFSSLGIFLFTLDMTLGLLKLTRRGS